MDNFNSFKEIIKSKEKVKLPSYRWQQLALEIIQELAIPDFKRNSVFKVCKDLPKERVLMAFNDTKELCHEGEKWKYFFKVIGQMEK